MKITSTKNHAKVHFTSVIFDCLCKIKCQVTASHIMWSMKSGVGLWSTNSSQNNCLLILLSLMGVWLFVRVYIDSGLCSCVAGGVTGIIRWCLMLDWSQVTSLVIWSFRDFLQLIKCVFSNVFCSDDECKIPSFNWFFSSV